MRMKTKLIQFAIDNGYKWYKWPRYYIDITNWLELHYFNVTNANTFNINDTITSKPFIEALARGINNYYIQEWLRKKAEAIQQVQIDYITTKLAFAIRDDNLDQFILDFLPKE